MTNDERPAMKPEHEELIEAVARKVAGINAGIDPDSEMVTSVLPMYVDDVRNALRGFGERGYVLAKLPDAKEKSGHAASMGRMELYIEGAAEGWNECLDEIETVRVDE